MSILNAGFKFLINLKGKNVTIERRGEIAAVTIKAAHSNYFRNMSAPEEVVIEGFEFILPKEELDKVSFGTPKRGDILVDDELGANTLEEIRPMIGLGGETLGYRVRTG